MDMTGQDRRGEDCTVLLGRIGQERRGERIAIQGRIGQDKRELQYMAG